MSKELEEAAEEHKYSVTDYADINEDCKQSFIKGANWQAARSFTKEDMMMFAGYMVGAYLANKACMSPSGEFKKWLKDFKPNYNNDGKD